MANITKKLLAQALRRKGWSIGEIAKELNMHKSGSISRWCRDIALNPKQVERLAKKQNSKSYEGRMLAVERLRKTRMEEVESSRKEGLKEIGKLSKRDFFVGGVAMYWSEGETCASSDQVSFINSDPRMLLFMLKWFREICKITDDKFSFQVKINKIHKNRIKEVENYWSELLGVAPSQFTKTVLIKSKVKKVYPNPENYYGTLRIVVRQGTKLRRKINGWVEGLAVGTTSPG